MAGEAALLGVVYSVLAFVAIHMGGQPDAITNVWFANAAAIAIFATTPRSRWPWLMAVTAIANIAANLALRGNLPLSASFVPGNLVEVLIGAWLLQRFDLAREFDADAGAFARALAAGGLLPQLAGATIGAATLQWHGFATFQGAWLGWYVDSTLGALAVLPLALALRQTTPGTALRRLFTRDALLFAIATVGAVFIAFSTLPQPFVFLSLPLVASVFVIAPLATFGLCFLLVLIVCAGLDYRWFEQQILATAGSHLFLYLPAAAAVLPAQLLALVVPHMRQLQADTAALTTVGGDVAAVFDHHGIFRGVNRAYERYWGRTRESLIGRSIEQGVDARYAGLARQCFERAWRGEPLEARTELQTAIGARVMESRYEPVLDAHGRVAQVLFSSHDVTELVGVQRELEINVARLRAANEGMQQFVRIASHDMREPLNTIVQFCGLIAADHHAELTAPARLYFDHVRRGAQRMRVLLDDVLSFTRLESSADIVVREIALGHVIDAVLSALAARIGERRADIEVAPLPDVLGNESLLVLLFQNLLSNGIKFTQPGREPQVRIDAREDGAFVVVTVADRGIGIAAADQPDLFVPFKRLHSRRQYDGTGLGLAICRRIADAMGGTIELESQLHAGTRVHVRLRRPTTTPAHER